MTRLQKLQCFFLDLMYKNYVSKKYMINCKVDDDLVNKLDRYIFLLEQGCDIPNNIDCDINNIISFNEDFISCMATTSFCAENGINTELCTITIYILDSRPDPEPEICTVINITERP